MGEKLRKVLMGVLAALGLFLVFQVISTAMSWRYIGTGVAATNTIVVSGHGELLAVPDIATFTFSVVSDKATVADAQADATAVANAVTSYLKGAGVDDKDIQTSDYSVSPQYDYQNAVCPQVAPTIYNGTVSSQAIAYCPPGKQVLKGYEVRQTTTVKVRDTKKAGELLAGVGGKGATEVSGLSFTFDDPAAPQDQARDKAITDAKAKAEVLAKQLGVTLVRVVSFNENGNSPSPMVYGMAASAVAKDATAPEISVGQNKIQSDVSITYEIR